MAHWVVVQVAFLLLLGCDEDWCRILSHLVRSGRSTEYGQAIFDAITR